MRVKKKILKKFNFLNLAIVGLCIFVGFMIVSVFSTQENLGKKNQLDELTQSAARIADSFELYNQKKFNNDIQPK